MKQNVYIAALLAGMLALAGCGGGGSGLGPEAVAEKEAAAAATAKAEAEAAAKAEAEAATKAAEEAQDKAIAEALAKAEADRKAAEEAAADKAAEMKALDAAVMALNKAVMAAESAGDDVTDAQIMAIETAHAALDAAIKALETDADKTAAQAAYDGAVAELMAVKDTKAAADAAAAAPKSVETAGVRTGADGLPVGESQTIEVKAGTPRDFGTKRYTCPEGTCSITFTNELGTVVAMATGGVTVADVPPPPPGPPTIGDSDANIPGGTGSGPVMLVRDERDGTTEWRFVVKSGSKESFAPIGSHVNNWYAVTRQATNENPIAFAAASNAVFQTVGDVTNGATQGSYITLGAWVIYPKPTLSSVGTMAHSTKPLDTDETFLPNLKQAEASAGYSGTAVGVTYDADYDSGEDGNQSQYIPWTGTSTLTANFADMEISGSIDITATTVTGKGSFDVTSLNIGLDAISISSNYRASGSLTTGSIIDPEGIQNVGTWNADFVADGRSVIGRFDKKVESDRHFGAFGATCTSVCAPQN